MICYCLFFGCLLSLLTKFFNLSTASSIEMSMSSADSIDFLTFVIMTLIGSPQSYLKFFNAHFFFLSFLKS